MMFGVAFHAGEGGWSAAHLVLFREAIDAPLAFRYDFSLFLERFGAVYWSMPLSTEYTWPF